MINVKLATLGALMSVVLVVAALLVVGGGIMVVGDVEDMGAAWQEYSEGPAEKNIQITAMYRALGYGGMIHHFKNYVIRHTPDRHTKAQARIEDFRVALRRYRMLDVNGREKAALAAISAVVEEYAGNLAMVEGLVAEGRTTNEIDAVVRIDDKPALDGLEALRQEFVGARKAKTAEIASATSAIIALSIEYTVVTGLILAGVVALLLWFTHLRLLRPLETLAITMKDLAGGNTGVEIPALGRGDEIGQMAHAVDAFRKNARHLQGITETVIQTTREVTNASKEISAASMDLSRRTENQAANIEHSELFILRINIFVPPCFNKSSIQARLKDNVPS